MELCRKMEPKNVYLFFYLDSYWIWNIHGQKNLIDNVLCPNMKIITTHHSQCHRVYCCPYQESYQDPGWFLTEFDPCHWLTPQDTHFWRDGFWVDRTWRCWQIFMDNCCLLQQHKLPEWDHQPSQVRCRGRHLTYTTNPGIYWTMC